MVLECLICREPFARSGDHEPLLLTCNHSLCRVCVTTLWESAKTQPQGRKQSPTTVVTTPILTCPVCRHSSPTSSIDDLKPNHPLIDLIENPEQNKPSHSCVECNNPASQFCVGCSHYMCANCFTQIHRTFKVSLQLTQSLTCDENKSQNIKINLTN